MPMEASQTLRRTVLFMLSVFGLIVLLGISQRGQDIGRIEEIEDSTVVGTVEDVKAHMGPMVESLKHIHRKNRVEHETAKEKGSRRRSGRRKGKKEAAPDPKDLTNTESVFDFLLENSDSDLILGSKSEEEELNHEQDELNVITLLIKLFEKQRADEWLVQLALWFHDVALTWPHDVKLTEDAVTAIETILLVNLNDNGSDVEASDLDPFVNKEAAPVLRASKVVDLNTTDEQTIKDIEQSISDLIEIGAIEGDAAIRQCKMAIENHISILEWKALLTFLVGVAEAAPVFKSYMDEYVNVSFTSIEQVVFEENPIKKNNMIQESAKLLTILERGCEEYPRISALIRSTLLKVLKTEEELEKQNN